jgi:Ca-activated chloride channel family protein
MEAGRARGRAWEITVDFVETVAFAAVVGAIASLVLAVCALLLSARAEAAEGLQTRDAQSGTLILRTKGGGDGIPALRQATDVHMKVSGMVARVRVTQRFTNPSSAWQEGIYVFPLP